MRLLIGFAVLLAGGAACAALVLGYALIVATPNLPSLDALTDYRPKVPLRIYTRDHVLIGEFGEQDARHDGSPSATSFRTSCIETTGMTRTKMRNIIANRPSEPKVTIQSQMVGKKIRHALGR